MALPNLLGGRVFSALFCEVFSEELGVRSEKLVEGVKDFMQDVLGKLCDHTCAAHPVLLNGLKTNLVEQFVDSKEASAKTAVENIVKAELGWVFTQDRSYEDTMRDVREMASRVRKSKVEHEATAGTDSQTIFELAKDVGTIPEAFIWKIIDAKPKSEDDAIRDLQVCVNKHGPLALSLYAVAI